MTKRQERMIAVSKWRYPNDGDLDKQTAFIEGYKFAKNDNFGFGFIVGMGFTAVLLVFMLILAATKPTNEPESQPHADYILNSPEWKIDTVQTIVNGRDTTRTYKFVKNY